MEATALRLLIRQKLTDGRLPHNSIPRVWGGAGAGEACDACEANILPSEFIMEGVTMSGEQRAVQLHVLCFYVWDDERVKPSKPAATPAAPDDGNH
jgi:hypothetical protein